MVVERWYVAIPLIVRVENERDVEEKRIGGVKIEAWLGNNYYLTTNYHHYHYIITKLWVGIIKATSVNLWMGIVATIINWHY